MDNSLVNLLQEALRWGLHSDECASFGAKWDDFVNQDKLCNCWMSRIRNILNPPKIVKVAHTLMCLCNHEVLDHVNNYTGLCVANGCNCFKFVESNKGTK